MSTIQNLYNDLKTLCKQWFYEKSEVNDALSNKQNNLVSGTNIKTINNQSLLGSGNISIQAGDSVALACVSDHYFDSTTKEIVLDACAGKVISDVSKSTSGLVDTYTITFNDNSTYVFTVTNGSDATVTVDSALSSSSTNPVQNKVIKTELDKKIATSSTSGLVKNDGTIMTSGTGSSNWAVGNHTHSSYVNPTIADNLTTNDATQVLSAKQGYQLNQMIGSAINYITGSGS